MAKNLVSGLILGHKFFFSLILLLIDVKLCCKLSLHTILRKTNELSLREKEKTQFLARFWSLWPDFGPSNFFSSILPKLDVRKFCKLSLYAISRKTNEQNLRKWQKTQFQAEFWPIWPIFGPPIFFSKSDFVSHQIL